MRQEDRATLPAFEAAVTAILDVLLAQRLNSMPVMKSLVTDRSRLTDLAP